MANAASGGGQVVFGSWDTVDGVSNTLRVRGAKLIDVAVNLTAGSTVVLQGEYRVGSSNALSFETIETYTADTYKVIRVAAARNLRLKLTVDNGGTIYYSMEVGNKE